MKRLRKLSPPESDLLRLSRMRFAYIDSHGNEVPIPSVDALALRIELGAIGPDTQLYDAQADHWAPASTHEIFHTLSRDQGADGFMAPPPVAPPPPAPTPTPAPPAKAAKPKPKKKVEAPATAAPSATDLGLTLADPSPPPPTPRPPEPVTGALDLTLDLAPPAAPPTPAPGAPAAGGGGGLFDYGDLGSGLQLEDSPAAGQPAMSFDTPMQFGGGGEGGSGSGSDLQLEQPMSEFSPDSPPGWMDQPSSGESVMSFSPAPAAQAGASTPVKPVADTPVRQRREPKDRPSAPKFKPQRSLAVPIFLTVLLLAIGVGGYWGWPLLQARLSQPEEPVRPAVVMPPIPAELEPRMRELAQGAIASAIAGVDAETRGQGVPAEMDLQWLSGSYLANASQFASVEAFWTSMGAFMDGVRAADWQRYHDELVEGAQAAGLEADAAAMVVARADSGYVAAADARAAAYEVLDQVVDAALSLHSFLLDNEDAIDYRPASSSTADPILEAVPSSAAIGDRMLDLVDGVTEGLSDMGSLDRVTRERLVTALTTRVQQVGVQ
jgi:hypothetical protein